MNFMIKLNTTVQFLIQFRIGTMRYSSISHKISHRNHALYFIITIFPTKLYVFVVTEPHQRVLTFYKRKGWHSNTTHNTLRLVRNVSLAFKFFQFEMQSY